ncbi:type IV pilin protein [Thalassiella azotivora]
MLARIRKAKEENEGGFTLIELLVVVIIIGILAAIAIPTFLNQREKAWERAAQSDLRNAATVMETYFSDKGTYAAVTGTGAATPGAGDYAFKTSDGVTLAVLGTSTTGYCINANHDKLTTNAVDFKLDSTVGKPQKIEGSVSACA